MESLSDLARAGTSAFAAGAGAAPTIVTINVAQAMWGYAEVVVANAGVNLASVVIPHLLGQKDAENDLEEISDSAMRIFAISEAGQIRFVLTAVGYFSGDFRVGYTVG